MICVCLMKVSKLFCVLTLNLKAYITTTYHLSFCLVIMSDNDDDDTLYLSDLADDTLPLDRGLSGLTYLEEQDREAGMCLDEDVEPVAGGRAPEPKTEYSEQVVFADGNVSGDRIMVNELILLVRQMFASCCFEFGDTMPTLTELIEEVVKKSNHEITRVTRIRNSRRTKMHEIFKDLYEIQNDCMTFHGTSCENADSITKKGFRGAVCLRAKFGKGIYTSSDVWEALAYAEPAEGDLLQTVLAVKLLQGPTTMGRQDMADFGTDEHGNEILTATNPEETIFCAAYGDQLLATLRIKLRYLPERKHTPAHHNLVRIYHPIIWNRIKGQTAPVVPPPVFSVPKTIPNYRQWKVGDTVTLQKLPTSRGMDEFNGSTGVIKMITTDSLRFWVELSDPQMRRKAKEVEKRRNVYRPSNVQDTWISCSLKHLNVLMPQPSQQPNAQPPP